MKPSVRAAAVVALGLTLASCQPPPRDIVVVWRNDRLVIDFPWSMWRLIGLQNREYCVDRVQLFSENAMLWTLDRRGSCADVRMPIVIGQPIKGFISRGRPAIRPSVTYGVRIEGIGEGKVDFVLRGRKAPRIVTDWDPLIEAPCASFEDCPDGRLDPGDATAAGSRPQSKS